LRTWLLLWLRTWLRLARVRLLLLDALLDLDGPELALDPLLLLDGPEDVALLALLLLRSGGVTDEGSRDSPGSKHRGCQEDDDRKDERSNPHRANLCPIRSDRQPGSLG
jgi:hypothetical protein